ncbi:hypothetical protein WJX73_005185 [Symbiochloris irregularis]|uniref:Amino acid transporter transmembrane domain-containing protein n=1 Tax=Symbiochloris irregularis TaxID=706552 RepID=A0AAW1NYC4_9CHLO
MEQSTPKELEEGAVVKDGALVDQDNDADEFERTGTAWSGAAHCITAVIGAGVLALPYSVGALGWAGGPIMIIMFAVVSMYASLLLSDAYRYPGPDTGRRNRTYMACVKSFLGPRQVAFAGTVQYVVLIIIGIGYTVTAAISMVTIHRSHCFHVNNPCKPYIWRYAVIFGAIQLLFSQIPDLHSVTLVSVVAAIMSIGYASIGLGLSIGKATEHSHGHGTVEGFPISEEGPAEKAYLIMAALGQTGCSRPQAMCVLRSVCFHYIQDTIKAVGNPPTERYQMRKASVIGISVTTFFYISIGCIGYAGFGDDTPANLLTGFGFYNPYWLVDIANLFVVIHLIGTWQVISQPWFAFVEDTTYRLLPQSTWLHSGFSFYIPGLGRQRFTYFRLVWRSAYVCFCTVMAALLPFFNDIVGIIGSLGFWPMSIHFPTEMHIAQQKLPASSFKAILLRCLNVFFFFIAVAGIIGNVNGVRVDTEGYVAFGNGYSGK